MRVSLTITKNIRNQIMGFDNNFDYNIFFFFLYNISTFLIIYFKLQSNNNK